MAPVNVKSQWLLSVGTGTNGFPSRLPWGPTWDGIHTSSGIHKDRHIRSPPVAEGGTLGLAVSGTNGAGRGQGDHFLMGQGRDFFPLFVSKNAEPF